MEIPSVLSPRGLPSNVLAGSFHVGFITFDMSISTTDSNLKSILKELTELISEELEVDNSQVCLLNVTSQEKYYLVRWGIFPAEPANYISNTIARSIILRLRDHRIQLPERFGNYKLMEWNAEPQRKLTSWQHRFLIMLVGSVTTLILSLSAIGIWLVHRQRQRQQTAYEPVGASIPERYLQPLQS